MSKSLVAAERKFSALFNIGAPRTARQGLSRDAKNLGKLKLAHLFDAGGMYKRPFRGALRGVADRLRAWALSSILPKSNKISRMNHK
jgi:hypothetical protein